PEQGSHVERTRPKLTYCPLVPIVLIMGTLKTDSLSHSKQPLYQQLATVFRLKIESGEWYAGMQLPTLMQLCNELGRGKITVRTALAELDAQGLITRARGQGTFVCHQPDTEPVQFNLAYTWQDLVEFGRHSNQEVITHTSAA